MSLLLDALKKTEQARQNGIQGNSSNLSTPELARSAGHNLFAAKAANMRDRARIGIIPLAIISGTLLAAIGGYYVWHEISYTPPQSQPRVATAPITQREGAGLSSGNQPASPLPAQPAVALPIKSKAAPPAISARKPATSPVAAANATPHTPQSRHSAATEPAPGVVIEHSQSTDTITPVLAAAYQAYRNGDFATAWQHYSMVLRQDAKNRDALLGLAAVAQQQGQDDSATQYYAQILTLDPRDPAAHAGLSALTTGDAAGTESRLKLLLTHRPDAAPLHFALGNLYAAQSRWGEAQQSYFNASNREPDNTQYAYNLAVSLDHLGQSKLAAQYYQRALQLDKSGSASFDHAQTQQRVNELTTR